MNVRPRAPVIVMLIALAIIAVGVVIALSRPTPGKAARPDSRPDVSAMRIVPGRYAVELPTLGRVTSATQSQLKSRVSGIVTDVWIRTGQAVSAGTPLLTVDPRDAQVVLSQREADVAEIRALIAEERIRHEANLEAFEREKKLAELARRALVRQQRLSKTGATSEDRLDAARNTLQQAELALTARKQSISGHPSRLSQLEARLKRAQALLEQTRRDVATATLKAPFTGLVASLSTAPGDRVQPGTPLLTLIDAQALEVVAQIPETWALQLDATVQAGGTVRATLGSERPVPLTLDRIARVADAATGTRRAFFRPAEPDQLVFNQVHELVIELPPADGRLAVPLSALYGYDRVYEVADGRLKAHRINRLGRLHDADGERIVIDAGALPENGWLLTTQLPKAIDGLAVRLEAPES
ncbi:MAG: HlyD family efflux transporter periplasmic adaptor subunit [Gammaproteobacteria bacterium]|nr:MAG: HlyD family efflux transporter periplasmic adaptor subunit [Gammaproteobacteria bacterium]